MQNEFHITTAYDFQNETWVLGRTGEASSLKVGDRFTRAGYYVPQTKFEEYINSPNVRVMEHVEIEIKEIESYNKKLDVLGENTNALLRIKWEGPTSALQGGFNVLIAVPCS